MSNHDLGTMGPHGDGDALKKKFAVKKEDETLRSRMMEF